MFGARHGHIAYRDQTENDRREAESDLHTSKARREKDAHHPGRKDGECNPAEAGKVVRRELIDRKEVERPDPQQKPQRASKPRRGCRYLNGGFNVGRRGGEFHRLRSSKQRTAGRGPALPPKTLPKRTDVEIAYAHTGSIWRNLDQQRPT